MNKEVKKNKKLKKLDLRKAREKIRLHAEYEEPVRPVLEKNEENTGNVDSIEAKKDKLLYVRVVVNLALALVGLLLLIFFIPKVLVFFMPILIALIISAIANPLVQFLKRKLKIARRISSVLVIVLVVLIVAGILYGVGYFIFTECANIYDNREEIMNVIESGVATIGEKLSSLYAILPESLQKSASEFSASLPERLQGLFKGFDFSSVMSAFGFMGGFIDILLAIIACILAAYFFTAQHDDISKWIKKITPRSTQDYFNLVVDNFKKAIGGYFKAQFIIMFIVFAIQCVAFIIMHVPYFGLVAFLIAFLDFLPVFGMGAVYWPWIAIDIFTGNYVQAIWLSVLYIVLQVIRQLLQPKLVSDAVEMNPLITLLCMYVGYRVAGIGGLILAIPIGMIIISLYRIGAFDRIIKGIRILGKGINNFRKY